MSNRPDGRLIAQAGQQATGTRLENDSRSSPLPRVLPGSPTRRRYLFPLAERLLWFCALSSLLEQVPSHEVNSAADANVLA